MESALHKARSVFNDIKGKDFDYQNKVVNQLKALVYDDRRKMMIAGANNQIALIESLDGLSSFPLMPEDDGPVKSEQTVKSTEPPSNETTSDPS